MLISNRNGSTFNFKSFVKYGLVLVLLVIAFFVFYPELLRISTLKDSDVIYCDAELVWKNHFFSNGKTFLNGQLQSDETAHLGKYSSKHQDSEDLVFGMTYESEAKPGDVFEVEVWMKKGKGNGQGFLVFSGKEGADFYKKTDNISKTENDWGLIKMIVSVPNFYIEKTIKIYPYSDGKGEVFFDDLKIKKLDKIPDHLVRSGFQPHHINLEISEKNYLLLEQKRNEAFQKGLLITEDDSWVKASILESRTDEKIPVRVRLKGDWLDHLKDEKWSFRIKLKDPFTWNRLKTFSIHTPKARYYALEWLLHEFWKKEGVLTTRYDFVTLSVNGEKKGIYAFEEHFEKHLLEYQQRREGPIVRFSEDALWEARQRHFEIKKDHSFQDFSKLPTANIEPFQENKIARSELLTKQFEVAKNLLFQYQEGIKPPDEIFDLDLMARFTAIIDVLGGYHGLVWHNQRFYYNPVTSLLEPIGFDGFGSKPRKDPLILGKALLENGNHMDNSPLKRLYNNPEFIKRYMHHLNRFTQEDYIHDFFIKIEKELNSRIKFLQTEFPEFQFDKQRILNRIDQIRIRLLPYNEHSVNANWSTNETNEKVIQLSNTHELPLQVVGTGVFPSWLRDTLNEEIHLPGFRIGNKRVVKEIKSPSDIKYVFYKPYGLDTIFSTTVSSFALPDGYVPVQEILSEKKLEKSSLYSIFGKKVIFKKGKYSWDKDIVIPKDYEVIFEAGVTIDMVNEAKFISRSPVFLNGTNEEPITIYSSDQSANGFSVLQSPETSKLHYVIFKDLNTLNYKGWTLTGAVTFYESDVFLKNCYFKDIHCEDALNTIRCNFTFENSVIEDCEADGLMPIFVLGK